jgi:hypothetical protein
MSASQANRNNVDHAFLIFEIRSGLFVGLFFCEQLARAHLARNPLHWRLETWAYDSLPVGANLVECEPPA